MICPHIKNVGSCNLTNCPYGIHTTLKRKELDVVKKSDEDTSSEKRIKTTNSTNSTTETTELRRQLQSLQDKLKHVENSAQNPNVYDDQHHDQMGYQVSRKRYKKHHQVIHDNSYVIPPIMFSTFLS
jgi:hypothetical protein